MVRYAITDRTVSIGDCARWAAAGVEFVQLRDKLLEAGALAELARTMLPHLRATRLLVNGRADVAAAVGAAGVHLSAHPQEVTPAQVRQVFAAAGCPAPVVSQSCHTLAEVERARDGGADLILFGPVFEKRVGSEVVAGGVGLEALREACAAAGRVRVLALGGVTEENLAACLEAGAAGVAGIRLFG